MGEGVRHWVMGTDAQVTVPAGIERITGKWVCLPPKGAGDEWHERQRNFVSTMIKLGWKLQNTWEKGIGAETFWLHGNRDLPGLMMDYISRSKHLQLQMHVPQCDLLISDHKPLGATIMHHKEMWKRPGKSYIGWQPQCKQSYNQLLANYLPQQPMKEHN